MDYTARYLKLDNQKEISIDDVKLDLFRLDEIRMYISIPGLLNFIIYFMK
jgi:hypothetical protein